MTASTAQAGPSLVGRAGRRGLAVLVLLLALLHVPVPAHAHNVLIDSSPKDEQVVQEVPAEVRLVFNEPVLPADFNQVVVTGSDGSDLVEEISITDATVTASLAPLPAAGEYAIAYRILSADGHPVSGQLTFTVAEDAAGLAAGAAGDPAPTAEATAEASADPEPTAEPSPTAAEPTAPATEDAAAGGGDGDSLLPLALGLGALLLVAAAVAWWTLRARRDATGPGHPLSTEGTRSEGGG